MGEKPHLRRQCYATLQFQHPAPIAPYYSCITQPCALVVLMAMPNGAWWCPWCPVHGPVLTCLLGLGLLDQAQVRAPGDG